LGSIDEFNTLPREAAERKLYECLANRRWAGQVASKRPFADAASMIAAAWIGLNELTDDDWMAAFKAHPRIGERGGDAPDASALEQSRAMEASTATLAALATENRQYEERFGYVFLIRASGRSGDEIVSELRRRMKNDPATELAEARRELSQIAQLRLERLAR